MKNEQDEEVNFYYIFFISVIVLLIGMIGYYYLNRQNWTQAFYYSASVMSLVGAADQPITDPAKIFAGMYNLIVGLGYAVFVYYIVTKHLQNN